MPLSPRPFIVSILTLGLCSCSPDGTKAELPPWAPPLLARGNLPNATIDSIKTHVPALIEAAGIPGLAVAIIADDEFMWSGGFGVLDAMSKAPVTASTVFEAASLGKPVLAVVALKLVEAGQLNLDRPIARDFADPDFGKDPCTNG